MAGIGKDTAVIGTTMRRTAAVALVGGGLLAGALPALAKNVACGGGECVGSKKADLIVGSNKPDDIVARGGDDEISQPKKEGDDDVIDGGNGDDVIRDNEAAADKDAVSGGKGDDTIYVREETAGKDTVACGEGDDLVYADEQDEVASDCETVITVILEIDPD
jgi:Ca2+-binding RTX toxin-like protein